MKVKAALARSRHGSLRIDELTLVEPRPDEILVKMVACGVAQADVDAIDGRLAMTLPFVPGSEGAGIVERVGGDVAGLAPGDSVVIGFDYCGRCQACLAGRPRACAAFADFNLAGRRVDGSALFEECEANGRFFGQSAFATHVTCRASCAIKLAKGSPLETLACLGGDILIGAGAVLDAFQIRSGDTLVVSGANAIGLAAVMVARACGASTIIVAEVEERRRSLASDLGATVAVHTDDNLNEIVRSLAADGARFALETTGATAARRTCLDSLAEGGICAVAGLMDEDGSDGGTRRTGTHVVTAEHHAAPSILVPKLASLHGRGDLPLERLIDFFEFEHVNDALEALRSRVVAKPVLRFSIGTFGDLDRAKVEGARADTSAPAEQPATMPQSIVKS